MKNWKTTLYGVLAVVGCAAVVLVGCAAGPSAVERHLFTVQTNHIPVVTNWVETVTATNAGGGVTVENIIVWRTNVFVETVFTQNTNAAQLAATTAAVTSILAPGWGELAGAGAVGLLTLWGALRSRRASQMTTGATVLAQSIETLLAVIETTPQGKQLSDRLKLELARNQNAAGVLTEIAALVESQVDNDAARQAARLILETIPART